MRPRAFVLGLVAACGAAPTAPPSPPPTPTLAVVADGEQQVRDLGTCTLESGERIEECRIGFRTFGKLDAARSNAVLFPTWFTGTTKPLVDMVPQKLVDTSRFHLILVDALADGVSSSPSNSAKQPRLRFPKITIRDMVESQRRLLDSLGIKRLHAVIGISMGGMQAFEWAVSRPDDVLRVVPIVGTPQLTSQDLLLWNAELHALTSDVAYANGEYAGRPPMRAVQDIHWLNLTTPAFRAQETSRDAFPTWLAEKEADVAFDWNDWRRQLEAMLVHDVAHGGSLESAARRVTAKMMVVVADQDHMVNPGPAKRFAEAAGAQLVTFDTPCGHFAPGCESAKLGEAVRAFLAR